MPMQPSPIAETANPCLPSRFCSMCFLLVKLSGASPGFPEHALHTGRPLGCSEKNPTPELVNRSASPWDDESRRPSHADKGKGLQREVLRGEIEGTLSGGLYFPVFC